jgi:hypothetical protein
MALADDIRELRDRTLGELVRAYDYYTDTKMAWLIVREAIAAGYKVTERSPTTGSVTTETSLADKARGYVAEQLSEATFQQFVAAFEIFFFDLLRLWLMAYPQSLGEKEVPLKAVLAATDKEAVTLHVVNKELNEIAYERPREWFRYLDGRAKLGCPTDEQIDRLAEAKASRDVLVHHRGTANKVYQAKAGKFARFEADQRLDIPERYHRETWDLVRAMVADLSNAAIAKATRET